MLRPAKVITDLVEDGQEFVIAHGGRGGRGNIRFATPRNPAPEIAFNEDEICPFEIQSDDDASWVLSVRNLKNSLSHLQSWNVHESIRKFARHYVVWGSHAS